MRWEEMKNKMNKEYKIFGGRKIRRVLHNDNWYFSVVDVVEVLSESPTPRQYWGKIKIREFEEIQLSPIWVQLKLRAEDGKMRETDCANLKGIFRIIQSIPSKKAEPFKLWLAKVGSERIDEMIDPEISIDRAMKTYLQKGYSKEWINQRLKTIEVRTPRAYPEKSSKKIFTKGKDLTDEWERVGVEEGNEFAILTNDMTEAWSDKSIKEYKEFKNLKQDNLRDNMTNLELVLNMLAEATTTEFSQEEDPENFNESRIIATKGGKVAGVARREIEDELGRSIVSRENARGLIKKKKKEKKKKKALIEVVK
jgi:prophage antirepressor-like protein